MLTVEEIIMKNMICSERRAQDLMSAIHTAGYRVIHRQGSLACAIQMGEHTVTLKKRGENPNGG